MADEVRESTGEALLLDGAGLVTLLVDGEGVLLDFARGAADVFHLSRSDIGKPLGEVATRLAGLDSRALIDQVMNTGRATEMTVRGLDDDRVYLARAFAHRRSTSGVGGVLLDFVDVTIHDAEASGRANEELRAVRESEASFRSLATNARDYITRFDRELRCLYANPATIEKMGVALEDFVGKTVVDLGRPAAWNDRLREVIRVGESVRLDWQGSNDHCYDVLLSPEVEHGRVVSVLSVARDITAHRAISDAVTRARVAEELREKHRVRDFRCDRSTRSGEVLHLALNVDPITVDGRAMCITTIEDVTEQVRADAARRRAEEDRERLQIELAHSQKMEAIGTLAGGIAHDFNNILSGILGGLSVLEKGTGNPFAEDIEDMKALVKRGAGLAKQLLGFARRGKYDVRPLDLAKVVSKTRDLFGRTQPGISIELVLPTDLTLLPPATSAPVAVEGPKPEVLAEGRGTILVVDDEAPLLKIYRRQVERLGYQVLTAASGAEAIEIVRDRHAEISLVMLDMTMPGLSGAATFDALRAIVPDLKVLLSSGFGIEEQAQATLARGGAGFIQKPFTAETLGAKLAELL